MDAKIAYLNADLSCENCSASRHWLNGKCSTQAISAFSSIVKVKGPYLRGEHVFHAGHISQSLYIVRDGVVKCERVSASGDLYVAGFYLSGELFGCEDVAVSKHSYDAIALEDSWVCEISLKQLEKLFPTYPDLQHCFFSLISERLRSSEKVIGDSFYLRAKYRLLNFLYDFHQRLEQRKKQESSSMMLHMNKVDIANHLGISPETLSRLLKELEGEKLIRNGIKQIELLDPNKMAVLCDS